jgi:penicillin G amidase
VVGAEYEHHLTLDTMNGFRAKRILDLLNAQEKLSGQDYARIQTDVHCIPAETFQQLTRAHYETLRNHPALRTYGERAHRALDLLNAWDCDLRADSVAGALYETTLHFAMERLYTPWLGDLTQTFIGVGFHPLLHPVNSSYIDRAYLIALRILQNEEAEWLTVNQVVRTSADILAGALKDALDYLEGHVGLDMHEWEWGRLHRASFNHPLGAVKPLDKIFNRGPFPYGGDTSTVWQAAFIPKLPIPDEAVFTASWRQIMDVSNWDNSLGVHPTGQSGHPASRHYADQMPLWLSGQHHPLLWSREKIIANQEGVLILE